MAPRTKGTKVPRITIACNSCRHRKQKCNGNRPVCSQCLQHSRKCDWPEQLKRGPEKGYIEALELRLRDTEDLLLKALSLIPDSQLETVLASDQSNNEGLADQEPQSLRVIRQAKRGTDHWKKFPLDTAQNVREWQQDCSNHEGYHSAGREADPETSSIERTRKMSGHSPTMNSHNTAKECGERSDRLESDYWSGESPNISHPRSYPGILSGDTSTSLPSGFTTQSKSGLDTRLGEADASSKLAIHTSPVYGMDKTQHGEGPEFGPNKSQEVNSWSGAPSVNFQEQFLW